MKIAIFEVENWERQAFFESFFPCLGAGNSEQRLRIFRLCLEAFAPAVDGKL